MSISLDQIVTAARDRHSAFFRTRIPNGVLARFLSDLQNELIVRVCASAPTFLAQTVTIALHLDSDSTVGTAGAGTTDGVPGSVSAAGDVSAVQSPAGALVTLGLTSADGATIQVAERTVTSATDTVLTSTGAGRTVNEDVGRILLITAGKGAGQLREIASNTATTWTHTAWSSTSGWVTPDATSIMQVVAPVYEATEEQGVVTSLPALTTRTGYLVKLSASGVPTIDFTAPIVASVEDGVPLPAMHTLLGGTIRYTDGDTDALTVTSYARRTDATRTLAVYPVGETIRFCGTSEDWADVASIDALYTPVAPLFTALTDLFLLPDAARPCLVASAAAFMALRVSDAEGVSIDASAYQAAANMAQSTYLSSVRLQSRARLTIMRGQD